MQRSSDHSTSLGAMQLRAQHNSGCIAALGAAHLWVQCSSKHSTSLGAVQLQARHISGCNAALGAAHLCMQCSFEHSIFLGALQLWLHCSSRCSTAQGALHLWVQCSSMYNAALGSARLCMQRSSEHSTSLVALQLQMQPSSRCSAAPSCCDAAALTLCSPPSDAALPLLCPWGLPARCSTATAPGCRYSRPCSPLQPPLPPRPHACAVPLHASLIAAMRAPLSPPLSPRSPRVPLHLLHPPPAHGGPGEGEVMVHGAGCWQRCCMRGAAALLRLGTAVVGLWLPVAVLRIGAGVGCMLGAAAVLHCSVVGAAAVLRICTVVGCMVGAAAVLHCTLVLRWCCIAQWCCARWAQQRCCIARW
ncbi:uncharacterized protein LOC110391707 isoform X5 [Numida meleagris]|uniref:uncharacterized protein LOC110391707 isoform X5 n=1 Tax=Numida meleagris TaxID=8996 RepID=UPI000B3DBA58|nr:uncharacterized protein LOC110391707 isoform X5 [Numida meleagris]